jgi:hypothetical protein
MFINQHKPKHFSQPPQLTSTSFQCGHSLITPPHGLSSKTCVLYQLWCNHPSYLHFSGSVLQHCGLREGVNTGCTEFCLGMRNILLCQGECSFQRIVISHFCSQPDHSAGARLECLHEMRSKRFSDHLLHNPFTIPFITPFMAPLLLLLVWLILFITGDSIKSSVYLRAKLRRVTFGIWVT